MVIDSSAILAIFQDEPERDVLVRRLEEADTRLISAATLVETRIVVRRKLGEAGMDRLTRFLLLFSVAVAAFDDKQAAIADQAFRTYGKGRHKAHLNFGDCFTYALAKQTGEPLLFKGDDFLHTDLLLA